MNWDRIEGNWKQLADNVKRQWDRLIDGQLDLWTGKGDHPKPVSHRQARQQEPSLKVSQINVETYNGVVQLSGFVDSTASQAKAVEIARAVKGVTSVKNDMRLR